MQFFEITPEDQKLVDLGRLMMEYANSQTVENGPHVVTDHAYFNKLCDIGSQLTSVGALFGKKVNEFTEEEVQFILNFQKQMQDKLLIEEKG